MDSQILTAQILSITGEVLAIEQVGLEDNFFALGGDSLQALEFILRVSEFAGIDLDVDVIFAAETLRDFALDVTAFISRSPASGSEEYAPEESP